MRSNNTSLCKILLFDIEATIYSPSFVSSGQINLSYRLYCNIALLIGSSVAGRGLSNSPRDPFVKIFLLPDEENFRQSKIRKRTLAPKFNETFEFTVSLLYHCYIQDGIDIIIIVLFHLFGWGCDTRYIRII